MAIKLSKKTRERLREFYASAKEGAVTTGRAINKSARVVRAFSEPIANQAVTGLSPARFDTSPDMRIRRPNPPVRIYGKPKKKIDVDFGPSKRRMPKLKFTHQPRSRVDWNNLGMKF